MDNHVRIFDTTLRDGEQSPGATMTLDEKLSVARKLVDLGVDVIEAGFPAASPGELDSVKRIAEVVKGAEVAGLCRTREPDIDAAFKAVGVAETPRLHVFIATSPLHLEHKLMMSQADVLEEIARGVGYCASLTKSVEYSAEDATRTDIGFLKEAFACAIEHGATTLNIPDTVGYTTPGEYFDMVSAIKREVVGNKPVIISTHCHNDLGLAVANSIAAITAGARQVECCVNGLGERAGNTALEEIVMALRTRGDIIGADTRINTREIMNISRLVSQVTGLVVSASKPIVGRNAFAHESGIHQHGMLKNRETYEIMTPADIGLQESKLVLGKHSGKAALQNRLAELGHPLSRSETIEVFEKFKNLADRKKSIYDEDLLSLVSETELKVPARFTLVDVAYSCSADPETMPHADVTLNFDGEDHNSASTGNGPVHAAIEALKKAAGVEGLPMLEYRIDAISGGADAQGRVSLRIDDEGLICRGQAAHIDVVTASARAYVAALNHREYQKQQAAANS